MENQLSKRQWWLSTVALLISTSVPMFVVTARMNILSNIMSEFNGMHLFSITSILGSLTMSITLPISGSLGDLLGRKKVYCAGLVGYILALVACVFANSAVAIMLGLALTGVFYGVFFGQQYSLTYEIYTEAQRPRWLSYGSVANAITCLLGPMVGGAFVDSIGWRYVFVVVIPVMALNLVLGVLGLPEGKKGTAAKKVDYVGIGLFVMTVMPFLYAMTAGGKTYPWFSLQIGLLLSVALVSAVLLVLYERKQTNPLIPLKLFTTNRTYMVLILMIVVCGFAYACMNYLSIYYQAIRGLSATVAGTAAIPRQIGQIGLSILAGAYLSKVSRTRYKVAVYGALVAYMGCMFMMAIYNTITPMVVFYLVELFYGMPSGIQGVANQTLGMMALDEANMGSGLAFTSFASTFGNSLGGAIIGCVLNQFWNVDKLMPAAVKAALAPADLAALGNTSTIKDPAAIAAIKATLPADLHAAYETGVAAVKEGLNTGLSVTFTIFGICIAAVIVVMLLSKWDRVVKDKQ